MKRMLIICNTISQQFKRSLLFLFNSKPLIQKFSSSSNIHLNDSPVFISWKVKNAWKVEIENLGQVRSKDSLIFNNYRSHTRLLLKAYGGKKVVSRELDLNFRAVKLPVIPGQQELALLVETAVDPAHLLHRINRLKNQLDVPIKKYCNDSFPKWQISLVDSTIKLLLDPDTLRTRIAELEIGQSEYINRHQHENN